MDFFSLRQSIANSGLRLAAIGLFTGVLVSCGGSGSNTADNASFNAAATEERAVVDAKVDLTASTPGAFLEYFRQKLKARPTVSPQNGSGSGGTAPVFFANGQAGVQTAPEFSGTNLQESTVDENDWIKTDGNVLYGLAAGYPSGGPTAVAPQLQAQRRLANGQLTLIAKLSLPSELTYSGMYLINGASRLALVGEKFDFNALAPTVPVTPVIPASGASNASGSTGFIPTVANFSVMPGSVFSQIGIDVVATPLATASNSAVLSVTSRIRMNGRLIGSRVVGSTLYVVSTWNPNLNKYALAAGTSNAEVDATLAGMSSDEVLPKIKIDDAPAQPLVRETDCYVQTANASLETQITTITAFNLASSSLERTSRCFAGGTQAMYMSAQAVYLASSRYPINSFATPTLVAPPADAKVDIHKFALAGQAVSYRGSGEVLGHLGWDTDKNAYRMSEFEGDLRVLTFTGQDGWGGNVNNTPAAAQTAPSPATLTVLRETAGKLQTIGTLPNTNRPAAIGKPGEQVYAVKFVGPRAYVVTFRQTDPLYILDLSNPADPKTVGELELPGYSDYLFPMGDSLLLGVGKDANETGRSQGVKLALIDVANPAKPSVLSSLVLGKHGSVSALDASSRGINILKQGDVFRIALPIQLNETPPPFAADFFNPTSQTLARFEVNSLTKTLVSKPGITSFTYPPYYSYNPALEQYYVGRARSVQIGSFVYYFSGGAFLTQPW